MRSKAVSIPNRRALLCGIIHFLGISGGGANSRALAFSLPQRHHQRVRNSALRPQIIGLVKRTAPSSVTVTSLALIPSNLLPKRNGKQDDILSPDAKVEEEDDTQPRLEESRRLKLRQSLKKLAKKIAKPMSYAPYGSPDAVLTVLSDATVNAVDMAVEEVVTRRSGRSTDKRKKASKPAVDVSALVEEAFAPVEESLKEMENSLKQAREALAMSKFQAAEAIQAVQASAVAEALDGAMDAVEKAEEEASRKVLADIYASTVTAGSEDKISSLAFEDIDYDTSEMAPPFIGQDQCLVPGEPVVRVEVAPENSRRIFAGIDILAPIDRVWDLLTDYSHLQDVVPNLSVNTVLEEYPGADPATVHMDDGPNISNADQCQQLAEQMKGAKLFQVGGAKIAGINFSARTTLEVREWPMGLPDFAHVWDDPSVGSQSLKERANDYTKVKLQRYMFPRPFAVSSLPTRDITMQSVEGDDGEFRMYQGVWRMQPLPGCTPPGKQAMRLTYAVEISPRAYLPVRLVEGRIVRDLCDNLQAIRMYVADEEASANSENEKAQAMA